ncbi:MAG TPA: DUF374 domain-containing protein [Candidatus Kryptonia bacterium]|nr:DUF374 domain-containing protein [Candidatus Kryptonia bacterium]
MQPIAAIARRWRFWMLEHFALPLAAPLFRLMMRTWRPSGPDPVALDDLMAAPRVVVATFHGMLPQLLYFWRLPGSYKRRTVVMLSPSRDGRLLAAALRHFDIDHVYGTAGSRALAGTREFIRRVQNGDIGVIAADGPLGPRCVAKPGFLQIAVAAQAHVGLAVTSSSNGLTFGSWDGAHLPFPFARVELSLEVVRPAELSEISRRAALQEALLSAARALRSPVLPPALRCRPAEQRGR